MAKTGSPNWRPHFCPYRTDFTRNPAWKSLPFALMNLYTKAAIEPHAWKSESGLLNIKAHHGAPPALQPAPHLIPSAAFLLKASTWTPKLPSWPGFPLLIKIRMYLAHKGPSVTLIQPLFPEHLLCTRQSACLWVFKNQ